MKKIMPFLLLLPLVIASTLFLNFKSDTSTKELYEGATLYNDFGNYWYQGKAEISTYKLEQARYGQMRNGHATLIFVTEDFHKEKQVKLDNPNSNSKLSLLKMNMVKKFTTGIYPYSMMLSVFSPKDQSAVKLSMSSQEWCGHTYLQLNKRTEGYKVQGNSYFESEGDINKSMSSCYLEDEIWNRIRLNPSSLPTGEVKMLPSSFYIRLKHKAIKPQKAIVKLVSGEQKSTYSIQYPSLDRELIISYNNVAPYKILSWEESYQDGKSRMTTKATLKKSEWIDYWNKNKNEDLHLRSELGIN